MSAASAPSSVAAAVAPWNFIDFKHTLLSGLSIAWCTSLLALPSHGAAAHWGLRQHRPTVLQSWRLSEIQVSAGLVHQEGSEGPCVPGLIASFSWLAHHLSCSLVSRCLTPISAFMFTWCFPMCISVSVVPHCIRTLVLLG